LATAVTLNNVTISISIAGYNPPGSKVLTSPDILQLLLDRFEIVSDHLDIVVDVRKTFRGESFEIGLQSGIEGGISRSIRFFDDDYAADLIVNVDRLLSVRLASEKTFI
jgi:hypothetical protein